MDISQLANTFLLLNMKGDNINYINVVLIMSVMYILKNYSNIYNRSRELFNNYIYKKCTIYLELKTNPDKNINNYSKKVLGILYYINKLNLNINSYEEVNIDVELKNDEDSYKEINCSHLIPKIRNFYIYEDIYVSIHIETFNFKRKARVRNYTDDNVEESEQDKTKEIKEIKISLHSYNKDMNYLKKFVDNCEFDYIKFLNRNSEKKYIFTTSSSRDREEENRRILRFNMYDFRSTKTFNNLFFEGKDKIINRIDNYVNNVQRYTDLGIAHTLGFLFHGSPGTGKTSTIKAIANYMGRSIITVNMKDINNLESFYRLFHSEYINGIDIKPKRRMYVFEEIDCCEAFLSRTDKKDDNKEEEKKDLADVLTNVITANHKGKILTEKKDKLTIGQVLEVLDGIIENDDRVCIFTTNHVEKIDKALLRPGRIDLIIEFKSLRKCDIKSLFKLWYNQDLTESELSKMKDYCITQAEFGKLCFENMTNPKRVIKELQSK